MRQKIKLFRIHGRLSSACQKHELVIRSAVNEVAPVSVVKSEHGLVVGEIPLLSVDSDKRASLRCFQLRRMERVLENVFVVLDAVQDQLVEEDFAVWKRVGGSDGQGTRRRESGVEKDLKRVK